MSTFLTDPPSATPAEGDLAALVARMERAVAAMETLTTPVSQVTPALAVAADAADEFVRRASDRGVDVDAQRPRPGRAFFHGRQAPRPRKRRCGDG